jgi:hypothetical protein
MSAAALPALRVTVDGVPDLLTSDEAARLLGYADRRGLWQRIMKDHRLRDCRLKGTFRRCWSRPLLERAGYLSPPVRPQSPAPSADLPYAPAQHVVAVWRLA